MGEIEENKGRKNIPPPEINLDQPPRDLVQELLEAKVSLGTIQAVKDTRPKGIDKRLTAPLAIRSRRGRIAVMELYMWVHEGELVEDLIDELSYLMGVAQRTLTDFWRGIRRKGRVREEVGQTKRVEI